MCRRLRERRLDLRGGEAPAVGAAGHRQTRRAPARGAGPSAKPPRPSRRPRRRRRGSPASSRRAPSSASRRGVAGREPQRLGQKGLRRRRGPCRACAATAPSAQPSGSVGREPCAPPRSGATPRRGFLPRAPPGRRCGRPGAPGVGGRCEAARRDGAAKRSSASEHATREPVRTSPAERLPEGLVRRVVEEAEDDPLDVLGRRERTSAPRRPRSRRPARAGSRRRPSRWPEARRRSRRCPRRAAAPGARPRPAASPRRSRRPSRPGRRRGSPNGAWSLPPFVTTAWPTAHVPIRSHSSWIDGPPRCRIAPATPEPELQGLVGRVDDRVHWHRRDVRLGELDRGRHRRSPSGL